MIQLDVNKIIDQLGIKTKWEVSRMDNKRMEMLKRVQELARLTAEISKAWYELDGETDDALCDMYPFEGSCSDVAMGVDKWAERFGEWVENGDHAKEKKAILQWMQKEDPNGFWTEWLDETKGYIVEVLTEWASQCSDPIYATMLQRAEAL